MNHNILVRDAEERDIPGLTSIKGIGSETIHQDRLRDAQNISFRYLVILLEQKVIGFACLVFRRPSSWSDAGDMEHLPQIVDLQIMEGFRGQGYGTVFIHTLEDIAGSLAKQIYLSVDPEDNPRAYALYQRLGYTSLQAEPYQKSWGFMDSAGEIHHGNNWVVDMVKQICKS